MSTNMPGSEVDLRTYLRVLRRRKWWLIGCAGVALAGAIAYSFSATKQYSATAQILVQPQNGTLPLTTPGQTITPTDVSTELQLLKSAPVVNAVKKQLHLTQLNVAGAEQGQTNVISVTATNEDPRQAARVANAYATEFVKFETFVALKSLTTAELQLQTQINAIEQELFSTAGTPQGAALATQEAVLKEQYAEYQVVGTQTTGGVTVVSSAEVPKAPSSPKKTEIIVIGLAIGVLVGLGVAFTAESLDDAIRSKDDLEHAAPQVPVMGLVPMIGSWRDRAEPFLATRAEPTSPAAEAYRSLRTSLQFTAYDSAIGSVLVTSPTATEGKTSTVANLGVVLATVGKHVVLVSADLRRPRLAAFFGLNEQRGTDLGHDRRSHPGGSVAVGSRFTRSVGPGMRPCASQPGRALEQPQVRRGLRRVEGSVRHGSRRQLAAPARHRPCPFVSVGRYHAAHRGCRGDDEGTTAAWRGAARPGRCATCRDRIERGPAWGRRRLRVRLFVRLCVAGEPSRGGVERSWRFQAVRDGTSEAALGSPCGA